MVFICHPHAQFTKKDIKPVYMGRNIEARPVNNQVLYDSFLSSIGTNRKSYFLTWQKNFFRRGDISPLLRASDADVMDYVRNTENSIGYVSTKPAAGSGVEVCGN